MIPAIIHAIASYCNLKIDGIEQVQGGDINTAYRLSAPDQHYFLKLNNAEAFPRMFERETEGLRALQNACTLLIPAIIGQGIAGSQQWLLLQWINQGRPGKKTMADFGSALAGLHRRPQQWFGWHSDNYIGSLVQINTQADSWTAFFVQYRLQPLVKRLFDEGVLAGADLYAVEQLYAKFDDWFPREPPALLHGDLWRGNYMITDKGTVAVFDPAVYCGHREMDLAMTNLFGGFTEEFYAAYHEIYPLEKGWMQRLPLFQLYPLLVHAALFGGHYIEKVKTVIAGCK